jgi:hypothetical protein
MLLINLILLTTKKKVTLIFCSRTSNHIVFKRKERNFHQYFAKDKKKNREKKPERFIFNDLSLPSHIFGMLQNHTHIT